MLLQEVQSIETTEQLEQFLLDHGEQIIDVLGSQVDRIERNIKVCKVVIILIEGALLFVISGAVARFLVIDFSRCLSVVLTANITFLACYVEA